MALFKKISHHLNPLTHGMPLSCTCSVMNWFCPLWTCHLRSNIFQIYQNYFNYPSDERTSLLHILCKEDFVKVWWHQAHIGTPWHAASHYTVVLCSSLNAKMLSSDTKAAANHRIHAHLFRHSYSLSPLFIFLLFLRAACSSHSSFFHTKRRAIGYVLLRLIEVHSTGTSERWMREISELQSQGSSWIARLALWALSLFQFMIGFLKLLPNILYIYEGVFYIYMMQYKV